MQEANGAPAQQLFKLIKEGCQQLVTLCDLCDQEKAAIETHNLDDFKATLLLKHQQLELIGKNIDLRNTVLKESGFSSDEQGFNGFINTLPPPQASLIKEHWQKLEDSLTKSIELNQRNELIVKRGEKNVSQLLALMQGHSAKTTLYNQKGSAGNYSAQNRLGKA